MSNDEGFEHLKTLFHDDMAEKIKALQSAVVDSNWDAVGRLSHQIGGTAKSFGYPEISTMAHELERSVRKISLGEVADLVKKISDALVL
ncbi:MAG TPA: Hpt domain-containing protein [Candidatus Acidoferrales bacterium]|nr:Hpt domain-containing protein [Candidatus Acidoferrales bacterium]